MSEQYGSMIGRGPRNAPQMGGSGFRGDQRQLAGMLMGQARGNGPGQEIARQQAQIATDRGLGQQLAMARSGRPGGSAMAARNAAMASGQLQGQGAQAATMGGLQAQQSAIGQLGGVLKGARGQDQNRELMNARLRFDTMGLDDKRQMELLRQQLQMNRFEQMGGIEQMREQGLQGRHDSTQPSEMDRWLGLAQGALQANMQQQAGQKGGDGISQARQDYRDQYGQNSGNGFDGLDLYGDYGSPDPRSQYSDDNLADTYGLGTSQSQSPRDPNAVDAVSGGSLGYQSGSGWNQDWQ